MSPKADVSAERKQQIYQAALACFGRNGYHKTTMDDIVAESGLSKGALYWYFRGKKELFLALFQDTMGSVGDTWTSMIDGESTTATEKLRASMAFFRKELEGMVPFVGILLEAWALTRHDEDVELLARQFYQPYLDTMMQIINEGAASGEFDVQSAETTSLVIITLFDGVILALATGLGTGNWDELMDAAESLVLHGVRARQHHE